tara:strand:- start:657 stop:1043 length:387 start_codon:yes stop_codon:yes gene_type:complete
MQFNLKNTQHDDEDETPVEWVKWYEGVNEEGTFTITADRISFKEENSAFYIIDEDNKVGTSVFAAHHPNAKFTDATPHGIRLANAIGRCFGIEGDTTADELCTLVNEREESCIVSVKKTDKGILWTVG